MKNKTQRPLAHIVRKQHYQGPSPFTYSQARDYPMSKLASEFVPTSKFWSRFNVSNEILIGTRGSGKTILLRMLTYSSLKKLSNGPYRIQFEKHKQLNQLDFIGFYVPLRLRIIKEIEQLDDEAEERRRFSFLFNCVGASSIINEIKTLLLDKVTDATLRLLKERELIDKLKLAWGFPENETTSTLDELKEQIDTLFSDIRNDWVFSDKGKPLDKALLEPIISVLPIIEKILGIDSNSTTWIACFDEAEYLRPNLQRVLNTVMRSESRGLAIKVATLPFTYTEFNTEVDGEYVQPDGDDFRFESIDYSCDDHDFKTITDSLIFSRLSETGLFDDSTEPTTLESFLGENTDKPLIDLYLETFKIDDKNSIEQNLVTEWARLHENKKNTMHHKQIAKLMPIFLLRGLYQRTRDGNTKVPRLSGATMVRRVTDGNVRRFIQICDNIFEKSRAEYLKDTTQHQAVASFTERHLTRAKSVYREGYLLNVWIETIANFIFEKTHSGDLKDIGIEFTVADEILDNPDNKTAFEMGIAYSFFKCPTPDLFYGITNSTQLKLSNSIAANKWLHMRAGTGIKISSRSEISTNLIESGIIPSPHNLELDFDNE